MRRLKVILAFVTVLGLISIPAGAQAQQCSTIDGQAVLDFGANRGRANVTVDGVRQVVPFFGTGFIPTGPNTADIRFVWEFDQGTLVVIEHSVNTPIGGSLVSFDSKVDIKKGGSGGMHWVGVADQDSAIARFIVTGEICFDR